MSGVLLSQSGSVSACLSVGDTRLKKLQCVEEGEEVLGSRKGGNEACPDSSAAARRLEVKVGASQRE